MIRAARILRTSAIRGMHSTAVRPAASVFRMPAMSPTMTEGGVVEWKYKSGDQFSAGDVLLEVETDKATIDVEASDDGVMWEIIVADGAKGVQVGEPIALLAEHGDDLGSLEKPDLKEEPKKEAKEEKKEVKKERKEEKPAKSGSSGSSGSKSASKTAKGSSDVFGKADPAQKFPPAVELLLHSNNISKDDALKIPASGPKGRLLKGDVLAFLGTIDKEAVARIASYIKSKEHLDLSAVQLATPEETHKLAQREGPVPGSKPEPVAAKPSNILTVRLSTSLDETISKETFQYAFEDSLNAAIRYTYAEKYPQYATSPSASSLGDADLFDDLVAPSVTKSRFAVYDVNYSFPGASTTKTAPVADDFDDLLGLTPSVAPVDSDSVSVEFKLKFDTKVADSKEFVASFERTLAASFTGILSVTEN